MFTKEEFDKYNQVEKEYKELTSNIVAEFEKAYKHCCDYLKLYLSIGPCGYFGVMIIERLIRRYEKGERTFELYEEMMKVE